MIDKPRIGYADKAHGGTLHAPVRYLPIIVVPGIMGSRLTDPKTDKLAWNVLGFPLGDSPKAFKVDYARLSQTSAELVPDETHGWEKDDKEYPSTSRIKHYSQIIPDFYGDLAKSLADLELGKSFRPGSPLKARVYCCGYDWRLDNARSALRLASVVEEALAETRERQVIIVAHSMGGLVARYYCRVLGGESKVFRVFLLGSPTLGAPDAYNELKNGPPGLYIRDYVDNPAPKDRIAEGISELGAAEKMGAMMVKGEEVKASYASNFGLWSSLCLGAGRFLRRKETVYFTRQLPAVYQILPSALYCRDHKNWLLFDPLATGHSPTGFMLVFPTLFELGMDVAGAIATAADPHKKMGDKMKKAVDGFFKPEEAERTSKLAVMMRDTIEERFVKIGKLIGNNPDKARFGMHNDDGRTSFLNGMKSIAEVVMRVEKSFLDCRSNRALYDDIYTGLLDLPEHRAISAANLALAYRFDEALTVDPCPVPPASPLATLAKAALLPLLGMISMPSAATLAGGGDNPIHALTSKLQTAANALEEKQHKARAYMHPGTFNLYCNTEDVEAGGLLFPTDILSNFDSNIVRWMLLPTALITMFSSFLPSDHSTGFASQAFGDGTVPVASANPPEAALSARFVDVSLVPNVAHTALGKSAAVQAYLKTQIEGLALDFLAT